MILCWGIAKHIKKNMSTIGFKVINMGREKEDNIPSVCLCVCVCVLWCRSMSVSNGAMKINFCHQVT